jgi:hypothetical protein
VARQPFGGARHSGRTTRNWFLAQYDPLLLSPRTIKETLVTRAIMTPPPT